MKNLIEILILISLLNINFVITSILYEDDDNGYTIFNLKIDETFNRTTITKDTNKVSFNDSKTSKDIINEMGFGWNLGNTLDAHKKVLNQGLNSEIYWNNPFTTEEIIQGLSQKGIRTIRIPVTWHNHLIDLNYTIDPEWMKRVKTIVDWSIKHNLYVILNSHHDYANYTEGEISYGQGFYTLYKDKKESEKFIYNIWKQITEAFNNGYDHHLIFEALNEPHLEGTDYSWKYIKGVKFCEEAVSSLNEYMNLIVKTIRESGGNNEKRFIMICPLMASVSAAINSDFIFPNDKKYNPNNNKLILSVHSYSPSDFAGSNIEIINYKEEYNISQYDMFISLYEKYILGGYSVIFGEFGAINKNNTEERKKWGKYYIETAKKHHMSCVIWDNGKMENIKDTESVFGIYDRRNISWIDDNLINSYIKSSSIPMEENPEVNYFKFILKEDFILDNYKDKLEVNGLFKLYNSFCRLCLKLNQPSEKPNYRALVIFDGDWDERLVFNNSELKNADFNNEGNTTKPYEGNITLEIFLNHKNYEIAKNKGLIFFGHGLILKDVYISGPRFLKMEPIKITKSQNKQKLSIYFTEDATNLNNNIIFENIYYNINNQISCNVDINNNKIIICEGIFNFTGEYSIKDSHDYLFTNRKLFIIPKEGEKNDINNFIGSKINFDDENFDISIHFSNKKFLKMNYNSTLMIELDDLYFEPKYRILYFYQGNTSSSIKFDLNNINISISNDNGLIIPSGNRLLSINLLDKYKLFKENGITIKGYGFSIKSIYFNEEINNNNEDKDKNSTSKENNFEIKIWVVLLIILIVLILIILISLIIKKSLKKNIIEEINTDFTKKEKILENI